MKRRAESVDIHFTNIDGDVAECNKHKDNGNSTDEEADIQ